VLVLHLLHLLVAAAGTYWAGLLRLLLLLDWRMEALDSGSATNWFIRGAEEDLFRPFFIASSTSESASRSDLSISLLSTSILFYTNLN